MRKGKPVFAPSDLGRRIGNDIKSRVENTIQFENLFFHLHDGGHVAALHAHRPNRFFAKVDLERFFYSVGKNVVVRALKSAGVERSLHYGRWSCVRNPYGTPSYALPYGFVQSPILATLVLRQSEVGRLLLALSERITVSVYMDDISISANEMDELSSAYEQILQSLPLSGFIANQAKLIPPRPAIEIFNCRLSTDRTIVLPERIHEFDSVPRSDASKDGFARYIVSVENGNGGLER